MIATPFFPQQSQLSASSVAVIRLADSFPRENTPRVRVSHDGNVLAEIDAGAIVVQSGPVADGPWFDPRDLSRALGDVSCATLTADGERWIVTVAGASTPVYPEAAQQRAKRHAQPEEPTPHAGTVVALASEVGAALQVAADNVRSRDDRSTPAELTLVRFGVLDGVATIEACDGYAYVGRRVDARGTVHSACAMLPATIGRLARALKLAKSKDLLRIDLYGNVLSAGLFVGRVAFEAAGVSVSVRTMCSEVRVNFAEALAPRGALASAIVRQDDLAAAVRTIDRVLGNVRRVEVSCAGGVVRVRAEGDEGDIAEVRVPCRGQIADVSLSLPLLKRALAACDGTHVTLQTEPEPEEQKRPIRFVAGRTVAVVMPVAR